ncbi:hypothetical protein [Kitasatospora cineracea]|uniref:Uncharacterized protein n=1 Tax=Kitasatospora cineracea TaxID=88074 RepID=A0A3N4R1Y8_9ACTN|nr:hypothetical protein [Kitasatospora cineracea]RPE26586.1 hypothetical protein EDD38_7647 [Kitasatospora cineracea]
MSPRPTKPPVGKPDALPAVDERLAVGAKPANRKKRVISPAPDGRPRRQFNTYLPTETLEGLRAISRMEKREHWEVLQAALEDYIAAWKRQQEEKAAAKKGTAIPSGRRGERPVSTPTLTGGGETLLVGNRAAMPLGTETVDWQTFNTLATVDVLVQVERVRTRDRVEIREVARRAVDRYVAAWSQRNPGIL